MRKKICLGAIFLLTVIAFLYKFQVLPIVIVADDIDIIQVDFRDKESQVNPLKNLDLNNCTVYIITSNDELKYLPNDISKNKVLYCDNLGIINILKENFNFLFTSSDVATVSSMFLISKGGKVIFKTNICIEENIVGLQNEHYGWLESVNHKKIINTFKQFKPLYKPIIIP